MIINNYKDSSKKTAGGGYKSLPFFIQAEFISDLTVEFCQLYIESYKGYNNYKNYRYTRQSDQMIQASRSSKQCIAEGYLQKSLEGRLKMLGVSRGSYEELLNDYQDFLRQRGLSLWPKEDPRSLAVRRIAYKTYKSYNNYKIYITKDPETAANTLLCLINQTNALLDAKLRWTEEKFVKEGGFRENLFRKRQEFRKKNGL